MFEAIFFEQEKIWQQTPRLISASDESFSQSFCTPLTVTSIGNKTSIIPKNPSFILRYILVLKQKISAFLIDENGDVFFISQVPIFFWILLNKWVIFADYRGGKREKCVSFSTEGNQRIWGKCDHRN